MFITTTPINGGTLVTTESYDDSGLTNGTPYFYVVEAVDTSGNISDVSVEATATPVEGITCYALALTSGANGSDPTASPSNSTGCSAGQYEPGEAITLTAHPDPNYQVATWTGTDNDSLTTLTNTLIMPESIQEVNVDYSRIPSTLCGSDPTLVGCWQMEENGGTDLVDGSSFANDGAITGTPTWVTGKTGSYALSLSGSGQYATIADSNSLDLTNAITITAWVKPGKVATQNIIKKTLGTTTANGYELSLSNPGQVFVRLNGAYRINSLTSYPHDGNTWMHVAATYDGTDIRLFINGVQEGDPLSGATIGVNSTNLG